MAEKSKAAKPAKTPKGGGGAAGGKIKGDYKAKPRKKKEGKPSEPAPPPRLKRHYETVVRAGLKKAFGIEAAMAVPRFTKVVVSMGIGDAHENARKLEALLDDVETVTGQRPMVTRARISVANFKLRQGMAVGLKVTLRGARMWEFLDRLVSASLPRVRDFRGVPDEAFDGRGNYSLGITEQLIFPELDFDDVDRVRGLQVNIVTSARTDAEGKRLLELLGMPFVKK